MCTGKHCRINTCSVESMPFDSEHSVQASLTCSRPSLATGGELCCRHRPDSPPRPGRPNISQPFPDFAAAATRARPRGVEHLEVDPTRRFVGSRSPLLSRWEGESSGRVELIPKEIKGQKGNIVRRKIPSLIGNAHREENRGHRQAEESTAI
jgi:hypothetical protein